MEAINYKYVFESTPTPCLLLDANFVIIAATASVTQEGCEAILCVKNQGIGIAETD